MKRTNKNLKLRASFTAIVAAAAAATGFKLAPDFGTPRRSMTSLVVDASTHREQVAHWRRAPFGASKSTVAGERRKAKKRAAVVRARKGGRA